MPAKEASAMSHARRPRPARPAVVAPITLHEFEALDRMHADVVQVLKQLERMIDRLEAAGSDDAVRASAKAICEFFDGHARAHHEEEERVVFPPLLAGNDAELIQHVRRLQQDHGWLEEDWREMRSQLSTIAEGYTGHDPATLREMSSVFCALYIEHIALEESLVYPASKQRLMVAEAAEHRRTDERP
jgi:hemerythrin-like domain-containing protein